MVRLGAIERFARYKASRREGKGGLASRCPPGSQLVWLYHVHLTKYYWVCVRHKSQVFHLGPIFC